MNRTNTRCLEDLDVLAFLALAVDMLEDYCSEIVYMMAERYAIQLLQYNGNAQIFQSHELPRIVLHILMCVNKKKTNILKQLNYNAHVDVDAEEYKKCNSLVDELFRQAQNSRVRRPLQLYKVEGIVRYSELVQRDWISGHRQAAQFISNCLTAGKCRQQMSDPFYFSGQQDTQTVLSDSSASSVFQRKEVY
ncbi:hypothetical protein ACHWQZ_G016312 [Mnemiopsis leidyi]